MITSEVMYHNRLTALVLRHCMIAEYESVTAHFYKSMETETISLKGITSYNRFIHVSDLI